MRFLGMKCQFGRSSESKDIMVVAFSSGVRESRNAVDAERRSAEAIWDMLRMRLVRQAERKCDFMGESLHLCGFFFGEGMLPNRLELNNRATTAGDSCLEVDFYARIC